MDNLNSIHYAIEWADPLGLTYFAWDYGIKLGHIQLLGVLSYSTPLLLTVLLLLTGKTECHFSILLACLLIIIGSLVASFDLLKKILFDLVF